MSSNETADYSILPYYNWHRYEICPVCGQVYPENELIYITANNAPSDTSCNYDKMCGKCYQRKIYYYNRFI